MDVKNVESGIIRRICIVDFLCHKNLELNLKPGINFITGKNGSGKSAILSALMIGLGGNASSTSRCSNIQSFIRTGCKKCHICITLSNDGLDQYKASFYGSQIHIKRKIFIDGRNVVEIYNEKLEIVSSKRSELNNILDHLNIQVSNPVCILNQETSRGFLINSDPSDKFKFFSLATHLFQINNFYNNAVTQKNRILETIKRKKSSLSFLEEKINNLDKIINKASKFETIQQKITLLNDELIINQIDSLKTKKVKIEETINLNLYKVKEIHTILDVKKVDYDNSIIKMSSTRNEIEQLNTMFNQLDNEIKELNQSIQKFKTDINFQKVEIKEYSSDLISNKAFFEKLENQINSLVNSGDNAHVQDNKKMIEKLNLDLKNHLEINQVTKCSLDQIVKSIEFLKDKYSDYMKKLNIVNNALKSKLRLKENLSVATKNKLSVFGRWVPDFVLKLDDGLKKKMFKKKPLGPIGSLIELKDSRWALAIEMCLKKLLLAICVDNHSDRVIVQSILKSSMDPSSVQPLVLVSTFHDKLYDISSTKAQSNYPTLLDMLVVESPIILNFLIDQASIEHVLLIEDIESAQHVMYDLSPKGAFKAFTIEGDVVLAKNNASFYSAKQKQPQFFRNNYAEALKDVENQIGIIQTEINGLNKGISSIEESIDQNQLEFKRLTSKNEDDMILKLSIETQLKSVSDDIVDDSNLELLNREKNRCFDQIKTLEFKIDEKNSFIEKIVLDLKSNEEIYKEKHKFIDLIHGKWETLKETYSNYKTTFLNLEKDINSLNSKMNDLNLQNESFKIQVQGYNHELMSLASQIIFVDSQDFVHPTDRSASLIHKEIAILSNIIADSKLSNENLDEIRLQHANLLDFYKKIQGTISMYEEIYQTLDNQIDLRFKRAQLMQNVVLERTQFFFKMLLSQRGYVGSLVFDQEKQKLHINVDVCKNIEDSSRDNKSMSGGEKSFSTLTFIMALWEVMDSPFRCLDEFDVFMDMVNRKISLHILIEYGKANKNRQIILLTPQDLHMIKDLNDVYIYRLEDPTRDDQS